VVEFLRRKLMRVIVIGIDPHKASVTATALNATSDTLSHRRLAMTGKTGGHPISSVQPGGPIVYGRWRVPLAGHGVA
jgi:hypothetical protein